MLKAEFDGRCAYCGENSFTQIEHIFHESDFPFDSYFNVVPACDNCNARKGGRTAFDAGMPINEGAYAAYCDFLKTRKVLHPFHNIKKGMLNLLCRPATMQRAQQMIGMIADNLVNITATQRAPRPLARYLATKLAERTGNRPRIEYRAARHTALYRGVLLPDYDKGQAREEEDLRNHAVDAIVLACELPSAAALENRKWTTSRDDVVRWTTSVRNAAPALVDGMPLVEATRTVPYFEQNVGGNYYVIDLSAFNWNRKRKAAHKLDPFGKTALGVPVKRVSAASVLAALLKGDKERKSQIDTIAHRALRNELQRDMANAATVFVAWLQKSIQAGFKGGTAMSSHPADQERRRLLAEFVAMPIPDVLSDPSGSKIPWTIGVRCLNRDTGARLKVNVARRVGENDHAQFYQSEAVIKEIRVGYREVNGELDRNHPVVFAVSQTDELSRFVNQRRQAVTTEATCPLGGRPLGSDGKLREFRQRWADAFAALCREENITKVFRISQGCVIEKTDGTTFQMRNFDKGQAWMKGSPFRQIRRVHRSPFRAMSSCPSDVSADREGPAV